ncbi:50S ribosomal protein L29, partial [Rhodococcus hoagii]|nr:50S ribosomal protein L29 [Prescottella equi]
MTDEEWSPSSARRRKNWSTFASRWQRPAGQQPRLRTVRHEIARIYTVLREREL